MKMKKLIAGLTSVVMALSVAFVPVNTDVAMAATKKSTTLKLKVDGASSKTWKMKDEYYKAVKAGLKKFDKNISIENKVTVCNGNKLSFTFEMDAKRKKQITRLWITELPPLYRDSKNNLRLIEFGWDDAPLAENTEYENGKFIYTERKTGIYKDKKNTYKISPNDVYLVCAYYDTNGDGSRDECETALIVSNKYKVYTGKMTPNWAKSDSGKFFATEKYKDFKKSFCNIQFSKGTKQAVGKKTETSKKSSTKLSATKPDMISVKKADKDFIEDGIKYWSKGDLCLTWYNVSGAESFEVMCKIGNGEYFCCGKVMGINDTQEKITIVDFTAQAGETYTYKVVAIGKDGKKIEGKELKIKL